MHTDAKIFLRYYYGIYVINQLLVKQLQVLRNDG